MNINEIHQAEAQRGLEWLNRHWNGLKLCPICGNTNWEMGITSELRSFNGGDMVIGGPAGTLMPIFPVTCSNCGLTHLFSAIKAGVVRMEDYARPAPEADQ